MIEDGQQVIAAKGGSGGKGNVNGKGEAYPGEPGDEKELLLDLKVIADVGLVGFPNSGKSTLISKVSNARPRIAGYPFTTTAPVLGVVAWEGNSFTVADIPGLIKDSHCGKGLGDRFLRHVERTKLLVHIIDMSGSEGRSPLEDYRVINEELKLYSREIFKKKKVVVANKMDLPGAQRNLSVFRKSVKEKIVAVSALEGTGIEELLDVIKKELFAHSS